MFDSVSLLVISDLHAHPNDPNSNDAPSFFSTNSLYRTPALNPLLEIPKLVRRAGLKTDWIVSPGDLGDRADPTSQKEAWDSLEAIRRELDATHLFGTAGNHDIDSRRTFPEFDPKSALQTLNPRFPIAVEYIDGDDTIYADRFWSRNFVAIKMPDYDATLVLLNSCAFHGYASEEETSTKEYLNGKVSPLTLEGIRKELDSTQTRLNIVLVHHHPHENVRLGSDRSVMSGGDILIDHLEKTHRQWIVIHGHRHVPHLYYASANPFSPVILSSGSVAAKTFPVRGWHPRNQIHHITFPVSMIDPCGSPILGAVRSWTWAAEVGWAPGTGESGIPYESGFGYRADWHSVRDAIIEQIAKAPGGLIDWRSLQESMPKLKYMVPADLDGLLTLLGERTVAIEYDKNGAPSRLERRTP